MAGGCGQPICLRSVRWLFVREVEIKRPVGIECRMIARPSNQQIVIDSELLAAILTFAIDHRQPRLHRFAIDAERVADIIVRNPIVIAPCICRFRPHELEPMHAWPYALMVKPKRVFLIEGCPLLSL